MPFTSLLRLWGRRSLTLPDSLWEAAIRCHPYARLLTTRDRNQLITLAGRFLASKAVEGAHGLLPTDDMRAHVAMRACLPILRLGLEYYSDWYAMVLHPADFRVHDEYTDEAGVVHRGARDLCGESLTQGPVVLSWPAIEDDMEHADLDLVIHECAHKIDLLNGDADGYPPLHASMDSSRWTESFGTAYDELCRTVDGGGTAPIDPYATTDPAEFFAVSSETFFVAPGQLLHSMSAVYEQLRLFYRQDPAAVFGLT